jgi:D-arabinose 1-dehydrogenase-like Zn-dependent alcohol dehydrogenase
MRATVVPAVKGKWEVREIPRPDIGPNQVLIQIKASGLCYTDVHITNGALPTKFPRVLGHEPVGEIVAVGSAVTTRRVGDRVGVPWVQSTCGRCEWCLRGKGLFCPEQIGTGVESPGSHAEFMPAFAPATVLIPDGVAYEQAAPIFCAGYTVWSGLRIAEPKPHEKVAVVGVGGHFLLSPKGSRRRGQKEVRGFL